MLMGAGCMTVPQEMFLIGIAWDAAGSTGRLQCETLQGWVKIWNSFNGNILLWHWWIYGSQPLQYMLYFSSL